MIIKHIHMSLEDRKQELKNYLYGRLSPEEEQEFIDRLHTMLSLREVLMAYTLPDDAPDEAESRLRVLRRKYGGPQPRDWKIIEPKQAVIWGVIALLVLLGWNFFYAYLHFTDAALVRYYYEEPADTSELIRSPALERAVRRISQEEYESALEILDTVQQGAGDYAAALFWQGHLYIKKQDYQRAAEHFDALLDIQPFPTYFNRERLEWNRTLARLGSGADEQSVRRQLALFSESEKYAPQLGEKARELERDLSSLYHQLLVGSGSENRPSGN